MNASTQSRNLSDVLGEITAGAQRVSIATRSWPTQLPKQTHLDDVASTLTGLQRAVAELRYRLESNATK